MVSGYLYAFDFPTIVWEIEQAPELGMSYEMADCHVENLHAKVWTITRVTFTGAAILARVKAAYKQTSFRVAAKDSACTVG